MTKQDQEMRDRYARDLSDYNPGNPMLKELIITTAINAGNRAVSAAYNGSWGDDGASKIVNDLSIFLEGIQFASTGKTKLYAEFIKEYNAKKDPEYEQYLALKAKFEK